LRALFSFVGGIGHFLPLVPVARASEAEGHTVCFGCGPALVGAVEAAGFTAFSLGTGSASPPQRLPLRPLDAEREDREFRDRFARRAARERVLPLLALCTEWRPDVLVSDETDFGAMVAAERLGLPHASVLVMAAGAFVRREVVGEVLDALRAEHGLPRDPELAMLHRHLVLSPFAPSFRDPGHPLPVTAWSFRPHAAPAAEARAANGSAPGPGVPIVYFTLGTVFNVESGDLFARVLAGLRELAVRVVVSVGPHVDPAELGPQPAHVEVRRYLAQETILPRCSLVVSHGGSGSVMGALAHGRPSVLIPLGADQPQNAARCAQLGVGRVLDPIEATAESVRAAASEVLATPGYRRAAERIRDEFAALPGPAHAARLLTRLASERRPVLPA
jgi:UDP:flavonoid glycosyltransferase YjiC (YdhE family)